MHTHIIQAAWHGYRINSIPVDQVINVGSPPEFPDNHRAILMADAWQVLRKKGCDGIWWLTCDVALDPDDQIAMIKSINQRPEHVWTGMVKLWPQSTGRDTWMWSHRGGSMGNPVATQDETAPVTYFSIDCVWTPAALLDLAMAQIEEWPWNHIDVKLSELAIYHRIPVHLVHGCRPKHLHFTKDHDGATIAARRTRPGNSQG